MGESQIGAVSLTVAQITHKCFSDIIPQKADEPLFSPCNLYSPRQSWSVLILECLHAEGNNIGQPSKVLTLWANWFNRCYDNMVITICQNSSWIGNNRKIQQHFPLSVVKNETETLPTLLTAFHSSDINAYSTFYKFLKNWQKNQQKSLGVRITPRSIELPMKPFGIRKTKMAAKCVLLTVVIALLFQSMPAKMEKSFDKFLKSDHTNNWAVLVRETNIKRLLTVEFT